VMKCYKKAVAEAKESIRLVKSAIAREDMDQDENVYDDTMIMPGDDGQQTSASSDDLIEAAKITSAKLAKISKTLDNVMKRYKAAVVESKKSTRLANCAIACDDM
jgi:DNA replicative helicase MCM subunit Mcm2 (Cdc46/Mcm family)